VGSGEGAAMRKQCRRVARAAQGRVYVCNGCAKGEMLAQGASERAQGVEEVAR